MRFAALFHEVPAGVALLDANGRVLEANPSLLRMLGRTAEEIAGRPIAELAHAGDAERVAVAVAESIQGNRQHDQIETRYISKDRGVVWGRLTVSGLRDEEGDPARALAMVEVIAKPNRTEGSLEAREARFRSLIENASEVVTILGADATIRYESPAVERVLGWRPDELEGRGLFEFVHPDDATEVADRFGEALQHPERKVAYELRFLHKDGSFRWLDGVAVNLLGDRAVGGIVANSRDVTERVESDRKLAAYSQALERERALFERLFESSPAAVVLTDPEDRVLRINPEFTQLFGYTEADAVGQKLGELIAPEGLQREALALTCKAAEGERIERETVRRRKDGGTLHVSVVGVPVRLHGDQIAAYGVYRDITAQKEIEAALEREATTDPLTGMLNRRGFQAVLERKWEGGRDADDTPLLLYGDVDGLKQINDLYGHAEGDRVLQGVAEALKRCFRASDAIARLGGDEFAVLATHAEEDAERIISERLRAAIRRLNEVGDRPYRVSMSLGAVRLRAGEIGSPEAVLAEADRRMYQHKGARRPRTTEGTNSPPRALGNSGTAGAKAEDLR